MLQIKNNWHLLYYSVRCQCAIQLVAFVFVCKARRVKKLGEHLCRYLGCFQSIRHFNRISIHHSKQLKLQVNINQMARLNFLLFYFISLERWVFKKEGCIFSAFVMYFVGCTSMYLMTAISIERFDNIYLIILFTL